MKLKIKKVHNVSYFHNGVGHTLMCGIQSNVPI